MIRTAFARTGLCLALATSTLGIAQAGEAGKQALVQSIDFIEATIADKG